MKIDIIKLEEITQQLFSKLKENKGKEIDLKNDYYWFINGDELFNVYEDPQNISIGQLSDDLKELMRTNFSEEAIPYDIIRLASILKAIVTENQTIF